MADIRYKANGTRPHGRPPERGRKKGRQAPRERPPERVAQGPRPEAR